MREKRLTNPLYVVYLVVALAGLLTVYFWFSPNASGQGARNREGQLAILPPKAIPTLAPDQRATQSSGRIRIGIVAGHTGFDSGAVCPDGLTEVSINLAIAERVVAMLQAKGIKTDLLEEFDPRQQGYVASALVSVHADACLYPEASGFKVASLEGSSNPSNQILVDCLTDAYHERTGMPYHANSITYDMTYYHVFDAIDPMTPGAIIEVGFMLTDRPILTEQPELLAQGIVEGIECFLAANGGPQ